MDLSFWATLVLYHIWPAILVWAECIADKILNFQE